MTGQLWQDAVASRHKRQCHFSWGGQIMLGERRYERVPFFCPLELTVLPNGPTVPGNSFDVSMGGIGVAAEIWLDRGEEVRVRLHFKNGSHEPILEDILGRVANSRADEDGNRIGIEFLATVRESTQPTLMQTLNKPFMRISKM